MRTINLSRTLTLLGVFYGPGDVQVPEEFADQLLARDAELTAKEEAAKAPITTESDIEDGDRNTETGLSPIAYINEVRKLLETKVVTPEFVIANLGSDIVEAVKESLPESQKPARAKVDPLPKPQVAEKEQPEETSEPAPPPSASQEVTLAPKIIQALKTAGHEPIENPEALAAMSDEDILKIDGIGPKALTEVRAYLKAVLD